MRAALLLVLTLLTSASSAPLTPSSVTTSSVSSALSRTYDYVIAGGGLTGLTVAARLTEDPDVSVLVIEQGQDRTGDARFDDVRTYGQAFCDKSGDELDHCMFSNPVPWRQDEAGQKGLLMVAGKMLSGSGGLNGASWTHGARTQYDTLKYLTGDDSWSFDGLIPLIQDVERFHAPDERLRSLGADYIPSAHGMSGGLNVSFAQGMFSGPPQLAHEASLTYFNMSTNRDLASGDVSGASFIPNMLDPDAKQMRASPLSVYIKPIEYERPNLVILTGQRVIGIDWNEGESATAKGVRFQASSDAEVHSVSAGREVILAAGAQQTPQLLELSGVGDPEVLASAGIPLRVDLPAVGRHLQEQTKTTLTFTTRNDVAIGGSGPANSVAFPLASQLLGAETDAVFESTISSLQSYSAELEQRGLVANGSATAELLRIQLNGLREEAEGAAEIFYTADPDTGTVGADLWNLIVMARGTVHVSSSDPWIHPRIEPSYFGHPLDLQLQTRAAMATRGVYNTSPLAEAVGNEVEPGLESVPLDADEDSWTEWVRQSFTSVWHPIATCVSRFRTPH